MSQRTLLAWAMTTALLSGSAGCVDDVWLGPEQRADAATATPGGDGGGPLGADAAGEPPDASEAEEDASDPSPTTHDAGAQTDDAGPEPAKREFCGLQDCLSPSLTLQCPSSHVCWAPASGGPCTLECEPAPHCGRASDAPCADGEFCLYTQSEALCGAGEAGGYCLAYPTSCVGAVPGLACGCDGVTYDTQCAAAQNGRSIAHLGACEPVTTGGNGGIVGN